MLGEKKKKSEKKRGKNNKETTLLRPMATKRSSFHFRRMSTTISSWGIGKKISELYRLPQLLGLLLGGGIVAGILSNVLLSPSKMMFIPPISASNFSIGVLSSVNPTFSYPIRLGTEWCSPTNLQQCMKSNKGVCCNTSANAPSPFETISDSDVVLIGLLLPAILLMIRTLLWRAMIATRFSSFGAYEGMMNGFAMPADCAEILVNSVHIDNLSSPVAKRELGDDGDVDAAALLTLTTADVDASVATTVAVVTRSGWLLFYWESLMCLAVADLYQAIVVAAAKVTYAMSCYAMLCYAVDFIICSLTVAVRCRREPQPAPACVSSSHCSVTV